MRTVAELTKIDDLAPYRTVWSHLLKKTTDAGFFQTVDWLEAYWRHHGPGQTLRVLVVSEGGEPTGILPLVVRTEQTRVGRVRVLTHPLHDWGPFHAPIGPDPAATLAAALEHVRRNRRDWDLLDIRWAGRTRPEIAQTAEIMRSAGFPAQEGDWSQTAIVEMSTTWERYWAGRPKKWRRNAGRLERRLAERGEVTHVRYRPAGDAYDDADPRWDLYDACVQVARRSRQASCVCATTLSHQSVQPYLRDAHLAAVRTGSLDLNLLLVDGDPVAFAYNYRYGGSVCGIRTGFDPRFAAAGPGIVLTRKTLESSFRSGDHLYDMGAGFFHGKRPWQTSTVESCHYTHFPVAVPRAQLLRMKRWLQRRRPSDATQAPTARA